MANQVALVTGGVSGMGRASALRFLGRGFDVVMADLNREVGEAFVAELEGEGLGDRVAFIRTDVSKEEDFEAAVGAATEGFGRLDVLVNAAGVGGAFGPLTEISVEDWDYTFAVLLRSVFLGIKHGGGAMREQGEGGAIVNFGSVGAHAGAQGVQPYSVAKAGVVHLTRVASVEFAADLIRINAVSPGIINTPFVPVSDANYEELLGKIQPLPVKGEPDLVAGVVSFLASDDARFITGQTVIVDGGMIAAGPNLEDRINNNPALRGLVGVNRGSTGEKSVVHRKIDVGGAGEE